MLMRFSVSNFMSFGYRTDEKEQIIPEEFHLYAGRTEQFKDRVINFDGRKILKFSSLYGANASGKTNLIRAIDCGRKIILSTIEGIDFNDKYCRSKKTNKDLPTLFEYEFTIKEKMFCLWFYSKSQ